MIYYHHGMAIQPSVIRVGHCFLARAFIYENDENVTLIGEFGLFAGEDVAYHFAVRCGIAFLDGSPLPIPPFSSQLITLCRKSDNFKRANT